MKTIYLLLCLVFIVTGCDRPKCETNNPVFKAHAPGEEIYKTELAKLLKANTADLRYYLAGFGRNRTFSHMRVSIQGGDICAMAKVTIEKHDDKIADMVKKDGNGYIGAELKGLKIAIVEQPGETQFMYNGLDAIVD